MQPNSKCNCCHLHIVFLFLLSGMRIKFDCKVLSECSQNLFPSKWLKTCIYSCKTVELQWSHDRAGWCLHERLGGLGGHILGEVEGMFRCAGGGSEEDLWPSGDKLLWALSRAAAVSAPLRLFTPPRSSALATTPPGLTASLSTSWSSTRSWIVSLCLHSTKPTLALWLLTPAERNHPDTIKFKSKAWGPSCCVCAGYQQSYKDVWSAYN